MSSHNLTKNYGFRMWLCLCAGWCVLVTGCPERRDPYAEHLLEQRNKAMKQLEIVAARDKTLDILCWDISPYIDKPNTVKQWATSHKGLDVLALAGPDLPKLKRAADMEEVTNSLERGWPLVTSLDDAQSVADQYFVINANGFRFDGVLTDPIEGWQQPADKPGRAALPSIIHLQIRYTPHQFILVYLTSCETVSPPQWEALAKWIEVQKVPTIVFGQFDTSQLKAPSLVTIDAHRLMISKQLEPWKFRLEPLEAPLQATSGSANSPYMIRCEEIVAIQPAGS